MSDWSWTPPPGSGISMRLVDANGMRFEVAEAGGGDRLALLLHGFPELNFSWRNQMPLLAALGYRVWAPNQRGYGASSRPEGVQAYHLAHLIADVAALIDAAGATSVTLVGHDWGAAVAWFFAMRQVRPLERLVILNVPHPACFARELARSARQRRKSWYIAFFQLPKLPELAMTARGARAVRAAFRGSAVNKTRFPEAVLDVYARAALRPRAMTAMINWYRAMARSRGLIGRDWPIIDTPTLVVWGEQDLAIEPSTLDGTADYVRDLTIHRLPNASHWVQQDAPEEVNAILAAWLGTAPAGSAVPAPA